MVWDVKLPSVAGACDSETIGPRFLKTMSTPALAQGNSKSVLQIRIQVFAVLIFLACQLAQPAGVWAVYVDEAQKYDGRMVEAWKDDMDATLVFAGLFSATVTAFLIESYKNLKPDPGEVAVNVLLHISQQLAAPRDQPVAAFTEEPFQADARVIQANVYFFLSLSSSLACALMAILVKAWSRNYLHATQRRPTPSRRARIRTYLFLGLEHFKLPMLVDAIPTTLHVSLFLFLAGLYEFFIPKPIVPAISLLALCSLVLCAGSYSAAALLSSMYPNCPYQSTISSIFWLVRRVVNAPIRYLNKHKRSIASTLSQESEQLAMGEDGALESLMKRDEEAIRWTLESLTDNDDFEPFVAGIPDFLSAKDIQDADSYETMLKFLLDKKEHSLGRRILLLLDSCNQPGFLFKERRAVVCIKALWALTSASLEHRLGDDVDKLWHQLLFPLRENEGLELELPRPRLTPISILREYARDTNQAISSRARLALMLVAGKIVQDGPTLMAKMRATLDDEALHGALTNMEMIHSDAAQALLELTGMTWVEVSPPTDPQSMQALAFGLLIVELTQEDPFGGLVLSHELPYPRSVPGFFARRLPQDHIDPPFQLYLVRSLKFVAEQVALKVANNTPQWNAVTEHFHLLRYRIDDLDAVEEAISLIEWIEKEIKNETAEGIETIRDECRGIRSSLIRTKQHNSSKSPRYPFDLSVVAASAKNSVSPSNTTMLSATAFTQPLEDLARVVKDLVVAVQVLDFNMNPGATTTPHSDNRATTQDFNALQSSDMEHGNSDLSSQVTLSGAAAPSITPTTPGRADLQGNAVVLIKERIMTVDLDRAEMGDKPVDAITDSPEASVATLVRAALQGSG